MQISAPFVLERWLLPTPPWPVMRGVLVQRLSVSEGPWVLLTQVVPNWCPVLRCGLCHMGVMLRPAQAPCPIAPELSFHGSRSCRLLPRKPAQSLGSSSLRPVAHRCCHGAAPQLSLCMPGRRGAPGHGICLHCKAGAVVFSADRQTPTDPANDSQYSKTITSQMTRRTLLLMWQPAVPASSGSACSLRVG